MYRLETSRSHLYRLIKISLHCVTLTVCRVDNRMEKDKFVKAHATNQNEQHAKRNRPTADKCGLYGAHNVFLIHKSDLLFNTTQPNIKLVRDVINTKIPTNFHEYLNDNFIS